jgi:hypothetical protein
MVVFEKLHGKTSARLIPAATALLVILSVMPRGAAADRFFELRPPASEYVAEGLLSEEAEALIRLVQPLDAERHRQNLEYCETLREDEALPFGVRRWATFMVVRLRTMSQIPLEDIVPLAEEWMEAHPYYYNPNVALRIYLASQYTYNTGRPAVDKKTMLSRLIHPVFTDVEHPRPATVEAGFVYYQLLRHCNVALMQDALGELLYVTPEERDHSLASQQLSLYEEELAHLETVSEWLAYLEVDHARIPDYEYYGERAAVPLVWLRQKIDIALRAADKRLTQANPTN